MPKGMDLELARQYVKVMDQIEKIVDHIYALGYMMSFSLRWNAWGLPIEFIFLDTSMRRI